MVSVTFPSAAVDIQELNNVIMSEISAATLNNSENILPWENFNTVATITSED